MGWPYDQKEQYTAEFQQLARDNGIEARGGAHNGVYDAYRHAYVSGRFRSTAPPSPESLVMHMS